MLVDQIFEVMSEFKPLEKPSIIPEAQSQIIKQGSQTIMSPSPLIGAGGASPKSSHLQIADQTIKEERETPDRAETVNSGVRPQKLDIAESKPASREMLPGVSQDVPQQSSQS